MSSAVFVTIKLLIGQSFSALSASSLEYVSAVSGSHSLSEAVLFFSLSLLRLVSSEHFVHLLNFLVSGHEYPEFPEACCVLYIARYSMTSYIKPYFCHFVKSFLSKSANSLTIKLKFVAIVLKHLTEKR